MILDFGKYKGSKVDEVPFKYILFLAGCRMVGTQRRKCTLDGSIWIKQNKGEFRAYAESLLEGKCLHCGSKLVPIGSSRMNGACHSDWDGRYLHKQCWKELKEEEDV